MTSKIITSEKACAAERWLAPEVAPGGAAPGRGDQGLMTAAQLERIQKQAYEEAYARGLNEGLAAGKKKTQERIDRLEAILRTLSKPLETLDEQVERELTALSLTVARHVIRRELSIDPGQVVAVLRESLAVLPVAARNIRAHLHPEDAALVKELLSDTQSGHLWRIVQDPAMTRGDCRIITDNSHIDATVERRLGAIAAALLGGERMDDGDERG